MSTTVSTQTFSAKHLLIGLVMGVISEIVISFLIANLFGFIQTMFLDTFYNNETNMFILGVFFFISRLAILAGIVVFIDKRFKNIFITIGTASGYAGSMFLTSIMVPIFIK